MLTHLPLLPLLPRMVAPNEELDCLLELHMPHHSHQSRPRQVRILWGALYLPIYASRSFASPCVPLERSPSNTRHPIRVCAMLKSQRSRSPFAYKQYPADLGVDFFSGLATPSATSRHQSSEWSNHEIQEFVPQAYHHAQMVSQAFIFARELRS